MRIHNKPYQAIVHRCEKGKDKKTKKSSLGLSCNKTDCKGSYFHGLRGLREDEMTEMLQKCANGEISLQKINSNCLILKIKKNENNQRSFYVSSRMWKLAPNSGAVWTFCGWKGAQGLVSAAQILSSTCCIQWVLR